MNKKQRAALEALRDVMREHDILFEQSCCEPVALYACGGYLTSNDSYSDISINEILKQENEQ
jgi:hypothetical protein